MRRLTPWIVALAALSCSKPRREGPLSVGATLSVRGEHGEPHTLRIDRIEHDPDPEIVLYDVSVHTSTGQWDRYCQPDREGKTFAIALQGGWDAAGNHIATDSITFACTNGALAKCVRWGYKPWRTVDGVSLATYHQACVHLVVADYCGNGRPHTRDGTTIDVWDRLGIQKRETSPGMAFEAAWSPHGAVYIGKTRLGDPLADVVAECPERLTGHTSLDAGNPSATDVAARWPEAILFTESFVAAKRP